MEHIKLQQPCVSLNVYSDKFKGEHLHRVEAQGLARMK